MKLPKDDASPCSCTGRLTNSAEISNFYTFDVASFAPFPGFAPASYNYIYNNSEIKG